MTGSASANTVSWQGCRCVAREIRVRGGTMPGDRDADMAELQVRVCQSILATELRA